MFIKSYHSYYNQLKQGKSTIEIIKNKMSTIGTNILRLQVEGNCLCYQSHVNMQLTQQDILQISTYIEAIDNNIIYTHPLLYCNQKLNVSQLTILLSKGETALLRFQFLQEKNKTLILQQISQKLLRSLSFLPNFRIKAYFNPFEQKNSVIPGIQVHQILQKSFTAISILPINLLHQPPVQISSSSTKLLLDYTTGRFYQPNQTIKVDKVHNLFHFRNGEKVEIGRLRKCKVLKNSLKGLNLVTKLHNYLIRIKQGNQKFLSNWLIRLQNKLLMLNNPRLISVDKKTRNPQQIQQIQCLETLTTIDIDQYTMKAQLVLIIPNQMHKEGKNIKHEFEKIIERMQLSKLKLVCVSVVLQSREDVTNFINNGLVNRHAIYILLVPKDIDANMLPAVYPTPSSTGNSQARQQNIRYFKQQLINRQNYFHIMPYCHQQQVDQHDILLTRNLAIIYCKMRLIPWKIKNLPFTDKPGAVCNLDVQQANNGTGNYSISLVLSMNLFFSKFCCFFSECQLDRIQQTIYNLLQEALNKFHSVHGIYPMRVFIFRTGYIRQLQQQHQIVKSRLANYYSSINSKNSSILTYIALSKDHNLRTYYQTDANYLNNSTIKKVQLLACMQIQNRYYLQLQLQEPPLQIYIHQKQKQIDQTFADKVLELIAKLCYGSVGNQFGRGLGFLNYANKLNQYAQFNITKWQKFLQQGVMMFL